MVYGRYYIARLFFLERYAPTKTFVVLFIIVVTILFLFLFCLYFVFYIYIM